MFNPALEYLETMAEIRRVSFLMDWLNAWRTGNMMLSLALQRRSQYLIPEGFKSHAAVVRI
jgi:hypothetical protein